MTKKQSPSSIGDAKQARAQSGSQRGLFALLTKANFEVEMHSHAEAILRHDMGAAASEIQSVLSKLQIPAEELVRGGGGEADVTQRIRRGFSECGWKLHVFNIGKTIDGVVKESISHKIDHVKTFGSSTVALEIEWNNKDPFFDRDLENFKRLHADGAISVGCIITRSKSLHDSLESLIQQFAERTNLTSLAHLDAYYEPTRRQKDLIGRAEIRFGSFSKGWANAFCSDKFGEATTHWRKLQDRVKRGVGNPCPLLLIGIPKDVVVLP